MNKKEVAVVALRISLGWFMFFAGIEKVLNPEWSAAGFLLHAQTFPQFYAWFAEPMNLLWVNPLNVWGITLIGVALLLGVAIRPAAWAGAVMMIVYYFPHVTLPYLEHGFIVEEHIVYAAAFIALSLLPEAQRFGLGSKLRRMFRDVPLAKHL